MELVTLTAKPRTEVGKKAAKALRRQGLVPCNLYGGKESTNFALEYISLRPLVYTPAFKLAEIEINGKKVKAIVKELQFDPVKDIIKHVDFQELQDNVPVKIEVPLKLEGVPAGVAMGGKLEQTVRKLKVSALPKNLPSSVIVNVADLDFGQVKRVRDIVAEGVVFLHSPATPVARLASSRAAKEAQAAAAAAPAKK